VYFFQGLLFGNRFRDARAHAQFVSFTLSCSWVSNLLKHRTLKSFCLFSIIILFLSQQQQQQQHPRYEFIIVFSLDCNFKSRGFKYNWPS